MVYKFNTIYNIDCMEFMKNIPNNYFDHIITDIPYEIYSKQYDLNKKDKIALRCKKGFQKVDADIIKFNLNDFISEITRIAKYNFIIFCNFTQIYLLKKSFDRQSIKCNRYIIWHKTNPNILNAKIEYQSAFEVAVVARKNHKKYFAFSNGGGAERRHGLYHFPTQRNQIHDTEKNHKLIDAIIDDNTEEGDSIYDPCCGSGAIVLEAIKKNRKAIGNEINYKYFIKANERLEKFKDESVLYKLRNE